MKVLVPVSITDGMIGSGAGTVSEVEHPEWAGGTTYNALQKVIVKGTQNVFTDLVVTVKNWSGIAAAPNGDLYAGVWGGSIWYRAAGTVTWTDLATGAKDWNGMCAAPNGDIYACVDTGSIWKRAAGVGSFTDLTQTSRLWYGMAAAPNGDIWAVVNGASGEIYKQAGGSGNFTTVTAGTKNWSGICVAPNGDVYASVSNLHIWRQAAGTSTFVELAAESDHHNWWGMCAAPNGDIYAAETTAGSIWKRTGGVGNFVDLVTGNKAWSGLAATEDEIYAIVYNGSIWVTNFEVVHKIYESLVASNIGYYPPIDVKQTTPKWLEVSSTNKWKVFDQKTSSQTEAASGSVYTITPGVAHDSIALLNLEATTVRVQGTSGAYDTSVTTGAKDIVLTNLGGLAANVLTITITNTAGLAKCGEIVIGNYTTLGTMKPLPVVSMQNYSTKTQDVFGDWTIIPRSSSEKINCQINITYSSIDTVINLVEAYKTTPVVWIGDSGYTCLILYGFTKDYSVPVATRGKSIMSLEVEGIT